MSDDSVPLLSELAAKLSATSAPGLTRGEGRARSGVLVPRYSGWASIESAEWTHRPTRLSRSRIGALPRASGIGCRAHVLLARENRSARQHECPRSAGAQTAAGDTARIVPHNSDSKLDSALVKNAPHASTTARPSLLKLRNPRSYHRYDPTLPPLQGSRASTSLALARGTSSHFRRHCRGCVDLRGRHSGADRALPSGGHGGVHAHERLRHLRTRWTSMRHRSIRRKRSSRCSKGSRTPSRSSRSTLARSSITAEPAPF